MENSVENVDYIPEARSLSGFLAVENNKRPEAAGKTTFGKVRDIMEEKKILRIKRLRQEAALPERKTAGSAGYDLCACIAREFTIEPGELVMLPTGLAAEIPEGCAGMIFTRSGLGVKHGIAVSNGVGVIDSDYRGEIHVGLRNSSKVPYTVQPGERIAQLIVMPVCLPAVEEAEELSETQRGAGGFGSTGSK